MSAILQTMTITFLALGFALFAGAHQKQVELTREVKMLQLEKGCEPQEQEP